jgi:hypothetical protein
MKGRQPPRFSSSVVREIAAINFLMTDMGYPQWLLRGGINKPTFVVEKFYKYR